jgi:glycosyltransferase involved in cell wall biosynthesis
MGLGGAERVVAGLANGLLERGHAVAVSGAPGALDAELPAAVRRLTLPERGRSPAGLVEWTARQAAFVRGFRPHVVHAHNTKATVAAAAAVRLARGPRRPPVLATHQGAVEAARAAAARLMRRAADQVVCVSEDVVFDGATVIHNGVSPPPPPAPREPGLVLFVGRLVAVKNPQRFLDAAALVEGARFVVVGDGPLRASLHGPATFLGARADARELMARAELLIVSSDSEGQSIAVLEALASGTPVVSTPVPGMRGLDGVLVVENFTPAALAAAVRELLADPARRERMGAAGAALVREHFSVEAMVSAYERAYVGLAPTIPRR